MDFKILMKQKLDAQAALVQKAMAENRAMTEEEQTQFDALEVEIKNLEKTIEFSAKVAAREAENKTIVTEPIYAEPKDNKPLWKNFGDFLGAVKKAGDPNRREIDNRLLIQNAIPSGAGESVASDGGFLLQQDFSTELLRRTYDTGVLPGMCRKVPISANSNGLKANGIDETSRANGARWGGIQSYWEAEADALAAKKPKFYQIELNLKKLTGLCYATDELLMDFDALGSIITEAFAEEFGFKLDDAILNGLGSGMPLGIMNSPALITVAKESGQTTGTLQAANIAKMWSRLWARSQKNAVWLINQDVFPQLYQLSLTVGNNAYPLWLPPTGFSENPYSTLFARPVIPMEQCNTLSSLGDIVLADLSQYLLIDKGGINAANSIHVRFIYDESVFRFIYRCDGQPTWKTAVTPFKGSNTQSPFVTLQAR